MRVRALLPLLCAYGGLLSAACWGTFAAARLDPAADPPPSPWTVVSLWQAGERVARAVTRGDPSGVLSNVCAKDCVRVVETIVDEAPVPTFHPMALAVSVAAGRDGLRIADGGREVFVTPADLLQRKASPGRPRLGLLKLRIGLDHVNDVLSAAADELGTDDKGLLERARVRKFVVRRTVTTPRGDGALPDWPAAGIGPEHMKVEGLRVAVADFADYLVRNQKKDGRFAYEIDPITGKASRDYNLPRHSGTTLFVAEAAALLEDKRLRRAARSAARYLRKKATADCGKHTCIGRTREVSVGAAALAVLAYSEISRNGISDKFDGDIRALTAFIRSQQRPDGEFMHLFDRRKGRPVDVQRPFYTGEAALALARAHRITGRREELEGARRALAFLTQDSWNFFGSRYFFGSEHWTCQALDELWDQAPMPQALQFCLDYQSANRAIQQGPAGTNAGAFNNNPFFPPRINPAASRTEAAIATLNTARRAGADPAELAALDLQVRRALAFVMRHRFAPGPLFLMKDPERVRGGLPGSPTDLQVRIDFPQHAGSAMVRYVRLLER